VERHNGGILYSWKFFLLEPGTFGRKEIICISEILHLLLQLGGEDLRRFWHVKA
jgi:hypothetical protein